MLSTFSHRRRKNENGLECHVKCAFKQTEIFKKWLRQVVEKFILYNFAQPFLFISVLPLAVQVIGSLLIL